MPTNLLSSRLSEKSRHFKEFAVWPVFADFDSELWLSNFNADEQEVAERLLANFSFFSERMTDALLASAIHNYFGFLDQRVPSCGKMLNDYIDETAFVMCEGKTPHTTDSGHLFARKLRDRLHVPEKQIFSPREALDNISNFQRFVFVDDFAGSGNQFLETWHRLYGSSSFSGINQSIGVEAAYCCCIAAQKAKTAISSRAPTVVLSPAHQLSERHSALHPSSPIWHGFDAGKAVELIRRISLRAGYGAEDGSQSDWRGFHGLALTLAFSHGIPDASLPLFFSTRRNWKPLIARSAS